MSPAQRRLPVLLGLASTVVGAAWSGRPSFWWDEAATVSMADRSLRSTVATLEHVDAVHGFYYVLIHWWFQLVGVSEFSARFPSAIAVGIATAAVVALAQIFGGTRLAVAVGVVFMVLPRVTWAATEARSYAAVLALSAVMTLVLVRSLRSPRSAWWILYGLVVALSIAMFLYSVALLPAHALVVAFGSRMLPGVDSQRRRADGFRFLGAAAAALVAVWPLIALSIEQSRQVSWIPPLDQHIFTTLAVDQWFLSGPLFAATAVIVVLLGAGGYFLAPDRWSFADRGAAKFAVVWMFVPMAILLGYSVAIDNIYVDRYIVFTTPAVALLLGVTICRLTSNAITTAAVLILVAAAALPTYVGQREPWGKSGGTDYSTAADYLKANAAAGDCVAFQPSVSWTPSSLHAVVEARPDAIVGLRDIGVDRDANSVDELWDVEYPVDQLGDRAHGCPAVWVVTDGEREGLETLLHTANVVWVFEPSHFADTELFEELSTAGFVVAQAEQFNHLQVVQMIPG